MLEKGSEIRICNIFHDNANYGNQNNPLFIGTHSGVLLLTRNV